MLRSPYKGDIRVEGLGCPAPALLLLSSRCCATKLMSPMVHGYRPVCMHILFIRATGEVVLRLSWDRRT